MPGVWFHSEANKLLQNKQWFKSKIFFMNQDLQPVPMHIYSAVSPTDCNGPSFQVGMGGIANLSDNFSGKGKRQLHTCPQ